MTFTSSLRVRRRRHRRRDRPGCRGAGAEHAHRPHDQPVEGDAGEAHRFTVTLHVLGTAVARARGARPKQPNPVLALDQETT